MAVLHFAARPMTGATATATSSAAEPPASQACKGVDPDLFFPPTDSTSPLYPNNAELVALEICAGCPLAQRTTCLAQQLTAGPGAQWGVSGGMTAAQRKQLLDKRKVSNGLAHQFARQMHRTVYAAPRMAQAALATLPPLAG